jgi:aromatic ring-opening dioxygenase catalytic subunit (LigB family)
VQQTLSCGVLIIGSGLSYHNLRNFEPNGAEASQQFDDWLQQTLVPSEPTQRVDQLIPQEDHLLPLMVAVGAAQNEPSVCVYHDENLFGGIVSSSFRFGNAAA